MKKYFLIFVFSYLICFIAKAEGIATDTIKSISSAKFVENKGQWEQPFNYKCELKGANFYAEKSGFTVDLWDNNRYAQMLDCAHSRSKSQSCIFENTTYKKHAYKVNFLNTLPNTFISGEDGFPFYHNYYLGNNDQNWKSNVRLFGKIKYENLYEGISLLMYGYGDYIKYDFVVLPGADPGKIAQEYIGLNSLQLKDENLILGTSLGNITELKPYAKQIIAGKEIRVPCKFKLRKNQISFEFPNGYDKNYELIIDPVLIFSTFTGASSDNWGYTATYDQNGNGYSGGIIFGQGYPTSTGAYDASFNGGDFDVSISKFNNTGNNLMFSTFLGGSRPEMPHSLIVNNNNELIVMGNTGSFDFPVTPGSISTTFEGGPALGFNSGPGTTNWATYSNGSDIFLTKFNAAGTAILASTFIGGSGIDGMNVSGTLVHNYADEFRGEVITDAVGNIYVTTSTRSSDFPTVNAFQPIYGGGLQDAVVFKTNPNLSSLIYSSYFGGSDNDAGYGIQFNSIGEAYFCGGTCSPNLPVTAGVVQPVFGGATDGFLVHLNTSGQVILNATYLGTQNYDQTFFVQIDVYDNVLVTGQTTGNYPIVSSSSGPVYSNPGKGIFIHKMDPTLTQTVFSTAFGSGTLPNIVPSAFLVDICNYIYISGWGGSVNAGYGGGNTLNLPVTGNALQSTTDGSDFYLVVFKEDAIGLHYATYFGGPTSVEHVDGGTSRFDKDGIVYQAICAGCGGHDDLPTTPGAYSATNNSTNCNLAIFKFDVSDFTALISPGVPPQVCVGAPITFTNQSTGGTVFTWLFGDGSSSNLFSPTHTYNSPGTYTVQLIALQQAACIPTDTAQVVVTILPIPVASVLPVNPICPGSSTQLSASGGVTYNWMAAPGLNSADATLPNPTVTPLVTTIYTVIAENQCGTDTISITVPVFDFVLTVSDNDTICKGESAQLSAGGGLSYIWSPSTALNNPFIANPIASPLLNIHYAVTATDVNNCVLSDTVYIQVDDFPVADAGNDTLMCYHDIISLHGSGGTHYSWSPPFGLNNPNIPNPNANPTQTTTYVLEAKNACGQSHDTVIISVKRIFPVSGPDTTICPGIPVNLFAYGANFYSWSPSYLVNQPNSQFPTASPVQVSTQFIVTLSDTLGCKENDSLWVTLFPPQSIGAGNDQIIDFGKSAELNAIGHGSFFWTPPQTLTCPNCQNTEASPVITTTYLLTVIDTNGCKAIDSVTIYIRGNLYVPNAFTPNGNFVNEIFTANGVEVKTFEMFIFNRWGEEIFYTDKLDRGWDGNYMGRPAQLGVYVYKINYTNLFDEPGAMVGHVSLIR